MNLILLPMQWGDEGVSTTLQVLARDADVILQFSQIRDACTDAGKSIRGDLQLAAPWILGNTLCLDLDLLFEGLRATEEFLIASCAQIVLPSYHSDSVLTARALGVVGEGVRVHQVVSRELEQRLTSELSESDLDYCLRHRRELRRRIVNASDYLSPRSDRNAIFLGHAGALRDEVSGLPDVLSDGQTGANSACIAAGLGPTAADVTVGVTPVFTVAPSSIAIPSEITRQRDSIYRDAICDALGHGSGGDLRYGHLDLVALRHACRSNSVNGLVLTHLDALAHGEAIRCCIAYENETGATVSFPASRFELSDYRGVTRAFGGLPENRDLPESFDELASELMVVVEFIEEFSETPVIGLSFSEDHTIMRRNPWTE